MLPTFIKDCSRKHNLFILPSSGLWWQRTTIWSVLIQHTLLFDTTCLPGFQLKNRAGAGWQPTKVKQWHGCYKMHEGNWSTARGRQDQGKHGGREWITLLGWGRNSPEIILLYIHSPQTMLLLFQMLYVDRYGFANPAGGIWHLNLIFTLQFTSMQ